MYRSAMGLPASTRSRVHRAAGTGASFWRSHPWRLPPYIVDSEAFGRHSLPTRMTKVPRYITREGFRRLAEEHWRIWTVERPRIVAEVEAAAALGDRSENAEDRKSTRLNSSHGSIS